VGEQGLDLVNLSAGPAVTCAAADCEKDQLRDAGASHVLYVEGSRNDYGFSLDITLRAISGEDSEKAQGWCNFCTGPQMVTAAENVARPLVAHLAARPDRVPGLASGAPGTNLNAPGAEGEGGSHLTRVLIGAGLAAAGAATIVVGSVTWSRAGNGADCFTTKAGVHDCISTYGSKNLGIGMVIGGAILAGVGGYLMMFTGSTAQVAVGPGGVAVAGTF
jgi:hypothetical protein